MKESMEDAFLITGGLSVILTTIFLNLLIWARSPLNVMGEPLNIMDIMATLIGTCIILVVIFGVVSLPLVVRGKKLFKQISTVDQVLALTVFVVFICVELYNVFVSVIFGTAYFTPQPEFIGNWMLNKTVNFLVSCISVLVVYWGRCLASSKNC